MSNYVDLSGRGGLIAQGRWHTRGQPVVYLADRPVTAFREALRHYGGAEFLFPENYKLLKVRSTGRVYVDEVSDDALPD